ncbi:MAG: helix-turn-helix domain-containing protein [Defluviitaleaceae bacterium]|nr:helix-turn-helix domain-containing protein [Defluviitaleaceae bacterium]
MSTIEHLQREFLNLGSNQNIKRMIVLRRKCEVYLIHTGDNNYKHIENTMHALKALIIYNLTDKRKPTYELAKPMLKNLEFGQNKMSLENNYNKLLLSYGIGLCENYLQAYTILKSLENTFLLDQDDAKKGVRIQTLSWSYVNFCELLLHIKIFNNPTDEELIKITHLFRQSAEKAKKILILDGNIKALSILLLKESQFYTGIPSRKKAVKKEFSILEVVETSKLVCEFGDVDYPNIVKNIGLIMGRERIIRGITQEQLAEMLGFTLEYISLMETGKRNITLKTILSLCKLFDLQISEMIPFNN